MKNYNYIILVLLIFLTSCKSEVNDKLIGRWSLVQDKQPTKIIRELNFYEKNQLDFVDEDMFKEKATYTVSIDSLTIRSVGIVLNTSLEFISNDSILILNNSLYVRDYWIDISGIEKYELLDIESENYLSPVLKNQRVIHYNKIDSNLGIFVEDKAISFNDLPLALEGFPSSSNIVIYLGAGITLKDLKSLYYIISLKRKRKVFLVTKKDNLFEKHYYVDYIDIWWNDLQDHAESLNIKFLKLPQPELSLRSTDEYLQNGGKRIEIKNRNDFDKLNNIDREEKCVIYISMNLPIQDYLTLKNIVTEKRKINKLIRSQIE